MTTQRATLAQQLFDGSDAKAQLRRYLRDAGVNFERIGWDHYDCSLEIHGVPSTERLSEKAQRVVHEAGFDLVYLNHQDHWETHYRFKPEVFELSKGWRVSYPRKRGEGQRGIWVEAIVQSWPKEWFDTGYAVVISPDDGR